HASAPNPKFAHVGPLERLRTSGSKGHWNHKVTGVPLIPKFASEDAAKVCELRNRDTNGKKSGRTRPDARPRRTGGSMPTRRQVMAALAGSLASVSAPARAQAPSAAPTTVNGWPARSVRVISPTGSGGPGQNFRLYAEQLKDTFGQSFVLENMPGGSRAIGCMTGGRAAPRGHTLLLPPNNHILLAPRVPA